MQQPNAPTCAASWSTRTSSPRGSPRWLMCTRRISSRPCMMYRRNRDSEHRAVTEGGRVQWLSSRLPHRTQELCYQPLK